MTKLKIGSASTSNTGGHDDHSGHDHSGHNHKRFVREVHDDHKFEGQVIIDLIHSHVYAECIVKNLQFV